MGIDHLKKSAAVTHNIGVAFISLNFRNEAEQDSGEPSTQPSNQLVQGSLSELPPFVHTLYLELSKGQDRPSYDKILQTFHMVTFESSRVFVAVDTLDECQSLGDRLRFFNEMFNLQAKVGVNLPVTSGFDEAMQQFFNGKLSWRSKLTMSIFGHTLHGSCPIFSFSIRASLCEKRSSPQLLMLLRGCTVSIPLERYSTYVNQVSPDTALCRLADGQGGIRPC